MANPQVIEALEASLAWAKEYNAQHVSISLAGHQGFIGNAGSVGVEENQLKAVKTLSKMLKASINNWQYPPQDPDLDSNYVVYNVARGPIGYDFLVWLVYAEMQRRRDGSPKPLKVGFWCGQDSSINNQMTNSMAWLNNVFRPSLLLIGAVETGLCVGHRHEVFTTKKIVEACLAGEEVPRFRLTGFSLPRSPYVTITLREASHFPHRNSDLVTWGQFARWLQDRGERVIFVRDTERAYESMYDFETDPLASTSMAARCALYADARANLFVSNGPATLAVFGDAPWMMFIPIEAPDSHYQAATAEFWETHQGVPVGQQYPWASRCQWIQWKTPTFLNLCAGWEDLKARIDG